MQIRSFFKIVPQGLSNVDTSCLVYIFTRNLVSEPVCHLKSKWSYDDHEKKWKSIVLVINRAACQSKIVPSCPVGLCHQDLVKVATAKN